MTANKMLTLEEVADYLEVSDEEVNRFIENGELMAFNLGGTLLRFKEENVYAFRRKLYTERLIKSGGAVRPAALIDRPLPGTRVRYEHPNELKYAFLERLEDFLYYNDFYIISVVLIALITLAFFGV